MKAQTRNCFMDAAETLDKASRTVKSARMRRTGLKRPGNYVVTMSDRREAKVKAALVGLTVDVEKALADLHMALNGDLN